MIDPVLPDLARADDPFKPPFALIFTSAARCPLFTSPFSLSYFALLFLEENHPFTTSCLPGRFQQLHLPRDEEKGKEKKNYVIK